MFGLLKSFRGRGAGKEIPGPVETFGSARIARALGEEILQSNTEWKTSIQVIRDRLTAMTRFQKDDLVDRLFARLALFVFDLPASESSHHSERFGLLGHLLGVAQRTALALTGPGFLVSPEPSVHHREGPLWAYAGVIAAIAHDIGKPLDLEVVAPGSSVPWDPRSEPLRLYCETHQLSGTVPALWHFKKGRGAISHERHIPTLLPMVITPEVETYLGPRLPSVLRALSPDENWNTTPDLSATAQEVIKIVRRIDKATSIADRAAKQPEGERAASHPPPAPPLAAPALPVPKAEVPRPAPAPIPVDHEELGSPDVPPEDPLPIPGSFRLLRGVPPDFHPLKVPEHSKRRGDPVETSRRMDYELGSIRFLDTVQRMLVGRRLSRNGLYSNAYLRPGYVWIVVPEAWKALAPIIHVPYDQYSVARMSASLGKSSFVMPCSSNDLTEFIKTRPDASALEAIRIKTQGFLKESEIESLGFHEFEIKVWSWAGRWEAPREEGANP